MRAWAVKSWNDSPSSFTEYGMGSVQARNMKQRNLPHHGDVVYCRSVQHLDVLHLILQSRQTHSTSAWGKTTTVLCISHANLFAFCILQPKGASPNQIPSPKHFLDQPRCPALRSETPILRDSKRSTIQSRVILIHFSLTINHLPFKCAVKRRNRTKH